MLIFITNEIRRGKIARRNEGEKMFDIKLILNFDNYCQERFSRDFRAFNAFTIFQILETKKKKLKFFLKRNM